MPSPSARIRRRVIEISDEVDALLDMLDGLDHAARNRPLPAAERDRADACVTALCRLLSRSRSARAFPPLRGPLRPAQLLVVMLKANLALEGFVVSHGDPISAPRGSDKPLATQPNSPPDVTFSTAL